MGGTASPSVQIRILQSTVVSKNSSGNSLISPGRVSSLPPTHVSASFISSETKVSGLNVKDTIKGTHFTRSSSPTESTTSSKRQLFVSSPLKNNKIVYDSENENDSDSDNEIID
jgi:hypothetical protein